MLKKYPTYKIVVYPTRRSASFPKAFYDDTLYAATHAKLGPDGNAVLNVSSGVPFPIPRDGQEAIWNHLLRYPRRHLRNDLDRGSSLAQWRLYAVAPDLRVRFFLRQSAKPSSRASPTA